MLFSSNNLSRSYFTLGFHIGQFQGGCDALEFGNLIQKRAQSFTYDVSLSPGLLEILNLEFLLLFGLTVTRWTSPESCSATAAHNFVQTFPTQELLPPNSPTNSPILFDSCSKMAIEKLSKKQLED